MAGTRTGKKTYASRKGSKGGRRPPTGPPKRPIGKPRRRLKGEGNVRGAALLRMRKALSRRHPLGD